MCTYYERCSELVFKVWKVLRAGVHCLEGIQATVVNWTGVPVLQNFYIRCTWLVYFHNIITCANVYMYVCILVYEFALEYIHMHICMTHICM